MTYRIINSVIGGPQIIEYKVPNFGDVVYTKTINSNGTVVYSYENLPQTYPRFMDKDEYKDEIAFFCMRLVEFLEDAQTKYNRR